MKNKKRILVIVGTRPEAIKLAPLIIQLKKNVNLDCFVLATGQHEKICDEVLEIFEINPDFRLHVMSPNQSLSELSCKLISGISNILENNSFDLVLVHGDTTTAFCGALASFYQHIPVGHVEAGLRSHNFEAPFPEEFNRVCIDSFCNYFFAPTLLAKENLLKEKADENKIIVTGNTAIDSLMLSLKDDYTDDVIKWVGNDRMLLLTAHRRENNGVGFANIFNAIKLIVEKYEDVKVVYPMHPNPNIRNIAKEILGKSKKVLLIEPQPVLSFHNLMNHSYLILTDSGGIQEEAPSLGKPVLVLREVTERPEGVKAGTLKIVGTDQNHIVDEVSLLLDDEKEYKRMSAATNPYGDGHASERIVKFIEDNL